MSTLPGKTITRVKLAEDRKAIKFVLQDGGSVVAKTDGECCSNSWIEHVSLPAGGFPATVLSEEEVDMPNVPNDNPYGDVTRRYGFKLVTDKGYFELEFRNESNGYYGGNLSWPEDYFYGGVFGQNVSNEVWRSLAGDI